MKKYFAIDLSETDGPMRAAVYRTSDVDARIARLEKALRYWLPDETIVQPEHSDAWDEHVKLLQQSLMESGHGK